MALLLVTLFASACTTATATWIDVESSTRVQTEANAPVLDPTAKLALGDATGTASVPTPGDNASDAVPEELAYAADTQVGSELADESARGVVAEPNVEEATGDETYSPELCEASANAWTYSAALNLLGDDTNTRTTQSAMGSVSEWLERSTVYDEAGTVDRIATLSAFQQLELTVRTEFGYDWSAFRASDSYTESAAAEIYETGRSELAALVHDACDGYTIDDLAADARTRAQEVIAAHQTAPSTVTESDALPGHAIFTHSSGQLIASFPAAWSHEERTTADAIVDFIASPDIARFLAGDAIDGVRLHLIDAPTIEDFRSRIDQTMVATSCDRTEDVTDTGLSRLNLTQTFDCTDHSASIVGQYRETSGRGLIIEASFDSTDASRMDLTRLASIANSALWS